MLLSACAVMKIIFERNVAFFVLLFNAMSLCVGLITLLSFQEMQNVYVPFGPLVPVTFRTFFPTRRQKTSVHQKNAGILGSLEDLRRLARHLRKKSAVCRALLTGKKLCKIIGIVPRSFSSY